MANTAIAALIAQRLPNGLIHPGKPDGSQPARALPLPGLNSTGIPADQAKQFANEAGLPASDVPQLIAEAVIHTIETDGQSTIITNTELDALRQAAADAPTGARVIEVHTSCPQATPLLELTIDKSSRTTIDCATLAKAIDTHMAQHRGAGA